MIGAGPAGSQTANSLSRLGHNVAIIDYRLLPGTKLCTGVVGLECVKRYDVPSHLIFHSVSSATIVPPVSMPVRIERDGVQAYVIDRTRFVQAVTDRAQEAGATLLLGRRALNINIMSDRVEVEADHNGGLERYQARAIVLATGFNTKLPRFVGLEPAGTHAYASQTEVSGVDVDEIRVSAGRPVPAGHFGGVVPTMKGSALVGTLGRRRSLAALRSMMGGLSDDGAKFGDVKPSRSWGVPLRPAKKSANNRVLMVGDAAGQVKPTTGGGIYYSMLSGDIAANVLSDALLQDNLSSSDLSVYDQEWRKLLGRELKLGYLARTIYERLSTRDLEKILQIASSNGLFEDTMDFDWHADLVARALGYKLLDSVLSPFRTMAARVF